MNELTINERRAAAAAAGIGDAYLYQCITGRGDMDPAKAVAVEAASHQRIRRWQLRRDWHLIWPELIGVEGAPVVPATSEIVAQRIASKATAYYASDESGFVDTSSGGLTPELPAPGFLHGGRRQEDHNSDFGVLDTNGPVLVEVIEAVGALVGVPLRGPDDAN